MILRFISFVLRIIFSFIFVLLLQIEWDGRSLENRILKTVKKSSMVQNLDQIAEDGSKLLSSFFPFKSLKDVKRNLAEMDKESTNSIISKIKNWSLNLPIFLDKVKEVETSKDSE